MGGPQLEGLNTKDSATHDTSDHFVARGDIGWKPYLSFFARHEAAVKVLRGLRHRQAHGGFGQKFFFFFILLFSGPIPCNGGCCNRVCSVSW